MPALLFGSISTLADTSELQREAFNQAFKAHDLDWEWSREDYQALLEQSGGEQRIADRAAEEGVEVDAAAVHATKSERFQQLLGQGGLSPRPGVVDTIREAKADGYGVAFVTTTSRANVSALLAAVADELPASAFDVVLDLSDVDRAKPAGDVYLRALEALGEDAAACVAIEDNVRGVQAATAAGVPVAAFPNANTAGHAFPGADRVVDHLAYADLRALAGA